MMPLRGGTENRGSAQRPPSRGKVCGIWRAQRRSSATRGIFSVLSSKNKSKSRDSGLPLSSPVTHLSVWLSSGCLSSRNSGGTLLPPSLIFLGEGDLEAGSGTCVYVCVRGVHTPQKLEKCRTFSGREPRARGSGRSEPRNLSVGRGRCWGAGGSEGGAGGFQIIPESLNPAPPGEEFVKGRERADAPHYRLPGHLSGALKESKH